ncbi:hypothetical protein BDN67DRAFT_1000321 [Paxillus ammoniavirescens]|nr:hypothetical protein BDN67DRAFT_1000321 [Paxillus ammoniavirescens]
MSESIPNPWIESYGAQLYNAPIFQRKKRVQLAELLTFEDNSYIWAWASDKEHRISIRIAKDAVDEYKRLHGRKLVDSRFSLVFISQFRPIFAPRPIGGNIRGNTLISHLSLEVGHVKLIGTGGHIYGNPLDLDSNEKLKEWITGLRQDGGGGNVLKLRKQEEQEKETPLPLPLPPPPSLPPPTLITENPPQKAVEDVGKPTSEHPRDLKRAYDKRWRTFEVDRWKFATKPIMEEVPKEPDVDPVLVPVSPNGADLPEPRSPKDAPSARPSTPKRTVSSSQQQQQQGTPSEWSASHRGTPSPSVIACIPAVEDETENQDDPDTLPTVSDPEEPVPAADSVVALTYSETYSLQPPTPAQRIKRSPLPRSSPPPSPQPPSSPEPRSSQFLHPSSHPPFSSSLPVPSPLMPIPSTIRNNVKRKVPHPGIPPPRPDPNKPGPIQILVPNSDTSGTGSSQPYSQSQQSHISQLYAPTFPSTLAKEFKPGDTSTPREPSSRAPRMLSEPLSILSQVDEHATSSTEDLYATKECDVDTGIQKHERPKSNVPPVPSAPQIEALEVEQSDTEDEEDELESARLRQGDTGAIAKDGEDIDADHEETQLSDDDAEMHSILQSQRTPLSRPTLPHSPSVNQLSDTHNVNSALAEGPRSSPALPSEQRRLRSPMHSLFSESLSGEQALPLEVPVARPEGQPSTVHVQSHDPETWKRPSFMSKDNGKGKARAVNGESGAPSLRKGKKRRRSLQPPSPAAKRGKAAVTDEIQGEEVPGESRSRERRVSSGMVTQPKNGHAAAPAFPQERVETLSQSQSSQGRRAKGRLANLLVDFEKVDLGKGVPMPRLDWKTDVQSVLLRTGRIRTLGQEVERDGSVYIHQE